MEVNPNTEVKHERITTSKDKSKHYLKVVRQDRESVEDLDCQIEMGSTRFQVINISAFGVLVETDTVFDLSNFICHLVVNNVDLGAINLRTVRRDTADNEIPHTVAFEVLGPPIDIERVKAVGDAHRLIGRNDEYQNSTRMIPDYFARKVYEIKDWLEVLQSEINSLERSQMSADVESIKNYEDTIVQVMGDYFNRVMPAHNKALHDIILDYDSEVIKNCYEFFREKLKSLIYQSPLSNRIFSKPLGYAGDYEMMNIMYRSAPEGDSLFAKCLDNYWIKQPAAQAVRNRANFLIERIKQISSSTSSTDLNVLSVACGPAMEWQEILRSESLDKIHYHVDLLDQDEDALKHAQRKLKEAALFTKIDVKFGYIHKTVKNIIGRGLDKKYDLIYSAGLFDYFSDPVAQIVGMKIFDALNPGGSLIIGNFNVENPNSIMMDLALDWHLIYRSKSDLNRLFGAIGGHCEVEEEGLGINLFCIIKKTK